MLLSHVGTSYYIAPEIVGKGGYGPAVDIWASGVVLYIANVPLLSEILNHFTIMLCGRFPFWGKTDIEYMKSLSRGPCMVGEGWDQVSEEGKQFLKQLLQVDPKKRLTAEQALNHPWVSRDAPSLDRRLSSISGLAVIASKNKLRVTPGGKSSKGKSDGQSDGPNSINGTVTYIG
ncbi:Serine/threonine protein kinase [Gracilaria domingensis]|nr:Serine/threonine protein kinase [Gracilaria domingensis]